MSQKFGLEPEQILFIKQCLKGVLEPKQKGVFWIFGSRARGDFNRYSDVDLLVEATPKLSQKQFITLKWALEDSSLPYKVDIVLSEDLAPVFRTQVEKEKIRF